jgi:hypothetical protein
MPFNVSTTATRKALPKPEILSHPLDTPVIESVVVRAAGVTADVSGPYMGRRYLLSGTILSERGDKLYELYTGGGVTAAVNEVQKITVKAKKGKFNVSFDGETATGVKFNATKEELQAALEGLSNIVPGDVAVTGGPGDEAGTAPYVITFGGQYAGTNVPVLTTDATDLEEGAETAAVTTSTGGSAEVKLDEVQKITVKATEGKWTVTFNGEETSELAFDITKEALQTALEALSNVASGDIVVTGGPGDSTGSAPYVLTMGGQYADDSGFSIAVTNISLKGGAGTVSVTTTTAGYQEIAGILFDTVEFADATAGSNEPQAMVCQDLKLDKNKIIGFEEFEAELLAWAAENNNKFFDVSNAQEA